MSKEKMILLLEAELEKPIEEMDAELIQHILEYLEPTPSLEQQYASWEKIKSLIHVLGLTLAQMLVEVAGRYHYSIIPMLILIAASNEERQLKCCAYDCD